MSDAENNTDRIKEDRFFLDEILNREMPDMADNRHDSLERTVSKSSVPEHAAPNDTGNGAGTGRAVFAVLMVLLLTGFSVPLILVYFSKWPPPGQHTFVLGFAYHELFYIYVLSAALLIHISLFLLRVRMGFILLSSILILLCCLPFIAGLGNNLTLYQIIAGIPFFAGWPYYLNPTYVMIEFLLPVGALIYFFLQIRSAFSRTSRGYAFLLAGCYLFVASGLGLLGINEIGQPNVITLFGEIRGRFVNRSGFHGQASENTGVRESYIPPHDARELPAIQHRSPSYVPPDPKTQALHGDASGNRHVFQEPVAGNLSPLPALSAEIRRLAKKVDGLETCVNEMKALLPERQMAVVGGEEFTDKGPTSSSETDTQNLPPPSVISGIEKKIDQLSREIHGISHTITRMAPGPVPSTDPSDEELSQTEETPKHR